MADEADLLGVEHLAPTTVALSPSSRSSKKKLKKTRKNKSNNKNNNKKTRQQKKTSKSHRKASKNQRDSSSSSSSSSSNSSSDEFVPVEVDERDSRGAAKKHKKKKAKTKHKKSQKNTRKDKQSAEKDAAQHKQIGSDAHESSSSSSNEELSGGPSRPLLVRRVARIDVPSGAPPRFESSTAALLDAAADTVSTTSSEVDIEIGKVASKESILPLPPRPMSGVPRKSSAPTAGSSTVCVPLVAVFVVSLVGVAGWVAATGGLGSSLAGLGALGLGLNNAVPSAAQLSDPKFNPFASLPPFAHGHPSCADVDPTYVSWAGAPKCQTFGSDDSFPPDAPGADGPSLPQFKIDDLACSLRDLDGAKVIAQLKANARLQMLEFAGAKSKQQVSAAVILPREMAKGDEPQVGDFPVIYALHPRDISYEVGEKNGPDSVSSLLSGIETWLSGVVCALNDPRMEPHLLVVPLRGGDRMWLDCYNKSICALETAIVDDLIPFIERSFPTKDVFSSAGTTNRACIGTSVGASGCLNLALKFPQLFPAVVVQAPNFFPRSLSWETLDGDAHGHDRNPFSKAKFLVGSVFANKADYVRRSTCRVLEGKLKDPSYMGGKGRLQDFQPDLRIWFGEQNAHVHNTQVLFSCLACNQMCPRMHQVLECENENLDECLRKSASYPLYLDDLFSLFRPAF